MNLLLLYAGCLSLIWAWLDPNHYLPWTTFRNDLLAWLTLLLVLFATLVGRLPLVFPRLAIVLLILAAWPALQFAFGEVFFFGDVLLASAYLVGFSLSIAVAYGARERALQFVHALAIVFVSGALLSFLIAICQWLSLDLLGIWAFGLPSGGRPYGNLAQPNNLASLLFVGIAAAIYLRLCGLWGRSLSGLVILLLLAGVAMTQSRMALVVLVVLLLWLAVGRNRMGFNVSRGEIVSAGVVAVSLWMVWPSFSDLLYLSSQGAIDRLIGVGSDVRLVMWIQLLDAAWQRPLTGWGWNQVSVAQVAVAADYPNSIFTEHSHNLFVDLMVWNGGVPGLLMSISLMAWAWLRLRQIATLPGWLAMAAFLVFGVHAMFEFPLDYAFFLVPMGFFVGIVEASVGARAVWQLGSRSVALGLLLGLGLLGAIFLEYLLVENDHRRLRFEAIGVEQRSPDHMAPDVMLLTQSREFLRFARSEARPGMSDEELEWMRQVSSRYAYPPAMFRYALALAMNERYQEAERTLLSLRQMHPEKFFIEAAGSWAALSKRYPQLDSVDFPEPNNQP